MSDQEVSVDDHHGSAQAELLSLRKAHKRLKDQYITIESHLNFLSTCIAENLCPNGIKISLTIQTPESVSSPEGTIALQREVDQTLRSAEKDILIQMREFYKKEVSHLSVSIDQNELLIQTAMQSLSLSSADLESHIQTTTRTEANLRKRAAQLNNTKSNKLFKLRYPPPQRKRPREPTQKPAAREPPTREPPSTPSPAVEPSTSAPTPAPRVPLRPTRRADRRSAPSSPGHTSRGGHPRDQTIRQQPRSTSWPRPPLHPIWPQHPSMDREVRNEHMYVNPYHPYYMPNFFDFFQPPQQHHPP